MSTPDHSFLRRGSHRRSGRHFRWGERGVIGGGEGLVFGVLILLAGSLAFVNIWAIVDTRAALDAASREYLRTYTEQASVGEARLLGELRARESLELRGTNPERLTFEVDEPTGFGPCSAVIVRMTLTVHWFKVPFLAGFGDARVTVQNRELIDATSEVTPDADYDPTSTACFEG